MRTDTDGRVKVLLTNERVYFVKTSGVPSPESILVSLKFEDVLDCHHLKNGKNIFLISVFFVPLKDKSLMLSQGGHLFNTTLLFSTESVDYVELSRKFSEPPVRVRCETASAQKVGLFV